MANNYQGVDFKEIDELLEFLPDDERKIVNALRTIILQSIPNCQETLSYNVPFYSYHSRICFIWPPSVPWADVKWPHVRLGFPKGYLLSDELDYLDKGNRKQVYYKDFKRVQDIDVDLLKSYLYEAAIVDEEQAKLKKLKKKTKTKT